MMASRKGHENDVAILVRHGANIDLQDKHGDTALHHAVLGDSADIVHNLLILGASQLCDNDRLTPLLLASNRCNDFIVEDLINRPECTKEQRIDALELLGASVAVSAKCEGAFQYMMRGMEERFQDPSNPLLKQIMEPVEAYQNKKESETCQELALIEGDIDAVSMEGFVMRERILGPDNLELIGPMRLFAGELEISASKIEYDSCIGLYRHSIETAQRCNAIMISDLQSLIHVLYMRQNYFPPSQQVILEVLEQTILVFEKLREKLRGEFQVELLQRRRLGYPVLDSMLLLLQLLAKDELCGELCEEDKNSSRSTLLQKLCSMNLCDSDGNSLLHLAAGQIPGTYGGFYDLRFSRGFPCIKAVKLLLNARRSNVNAINNKGDTPLHRAATLDLHDSRKNHLITDMMKTLLDGGAHHDLTNNDGKTAMDLAINMEAYNFLSEKKRLSELTCISARAVKKFRLPYLGVVPKTLEKFIGMH